MNKNPVKDFCEMHGINIIDTNKRAHKMTKMNTKFFQFSDDYNIVKEEILQYETEPLFTIEITESELQKIAEFESQVFNHMRAKGHYDMFSVMIEQKEREKLLRDRYPAVQKAYENYSLMLKLGESGEL